MRAAARRRFVLRVVLMALLASIHMLLVRAALGTGHNSLLYYQYGRGKLAHGLPINAAIDKSVPGQEYHGST
jgi:hypothetical protein